MGNTIINVKDGVIRQQRNTVLKGVNVEIGEGEFVYIIGKVGSGKSSFLKTLYAELPLEYGTAEVVGFQLKKLRKSQVPMLRRKCGIVFQDFKLLIDRNVYKNLEFVLRATGWRDKKAIRERIDTVLDMVDMSNKQEKMPHQLSGGEQQRIVLARALLNAPPLILADEPTGNIDPETSYRLVELLKEICSTGKTVIIATHQYDLIERFPGRVLCCEDGRMYEKPMPESCECREQAPREEEVAVIPEAAVAAEALSANPEPEEAEPEKPEELPAKEPSGMIEVNKEEIRPEEPESIPETPEAPQEAQEPEKEEKTEEEEEDILALIGKLDYPEITAFDYELGMGHLTEVWFEEEKAIADGATENVTPSPAVEEAPVQTETAKETPETIPPVKTEEEPVRDEQPDATPEPAPEILPAGEEAPKKAAETLTMDLELID